MFARRPLVACIKGRKSVAWPRTDGEKSEGKKKVPFPAMRSRQTGPLQKQRKRRTKNKERVLYSASISVSEVRSLRVEGELNIRRDKGETGGKKGVPKRGLLEGPRCVPGEGRKKSEKRKTPGRSRRSRPPGCMKKGLTSSLLHVGTGKKGARVAAIHIAAR